MAKTLRQRLIDYGKKEYGTSADRPFSTAPAYEVLRHEGSGKWYALFMDIPASKLGLARDDVVDIINLKCDPMLAGSLRDGVGIFPGYHMNRQNWITVLLDGTVPFGDVRGLMDISFQLTAKGGGRASGSGTADWLIPANPGYYDIDKGFAESADGTILWKQNGGVRVGDTVYIYVAAPVSAIRYRCEAVEVNIPYRYEDENVRMSKVMRLKLAERYNGVTIGRDLMEKHGVRAVRGQRSMPRGLISEIKSLYTG